MQLLNYKETRPNREPDLETMKRARKKGIANTEQKFETPLKPRVNAV